jgi:hypothetical protein
MNHLRTKLPLRKFATKTVIASSVGSTTTVQDGLHAFSKPQRELLLSQSQPQQTAADPSYSAQQKTMIDRILHAPVAQTEGQIRKDLSIAHRLMARYGFDDLCWNRKSFFDIP